MICSIVAASSTSFVKQPTWSNDDAYATRPYRDTRPYDGFKPTQPHIAAGCRTEPPVSVPNAATHSSAETAAADPPEEPPGMRVMSQGFRVTPNAEFSVELPIANSSMFNRPKMMAPAAFNFSTTVASYGEINLPRIFDPQFNG